LAKIRYAVRFSRHMNASAASAIGRGHARGTASSSREARHFPQVSRKVQHEGLPATETQHILEKDKKREGG